MLAHTLAPLAGLLLAANQGLAIPLDVNDVSSIKDAAATIAGNAMEYYHGNLSGNVPGLFPPPYYWWEGGLAWDSLVNYWALTGDDAYVDITSQALLWQVGPDNNYMPPNQTKSLGNDDQSTWGLAAMNAAERGFPQAVGQNVSWIRLAENVFDTQIKRWDTETCGGGLRWQIFTFNPGYNYKNSVSAGNLMELAARLAVYTGKQKYADWASKVDKWSRDVGLVVDGKVYDGTSNDLNCSTINHIQWTQSAGRYMSGATYMYNFTEGNKYWSAIQFEYLVDSNKTFIEDGVMVERACQPNNNCDTDQLAFRAVLARAFANVRDLSMDSQVSYNNMTTTVSLKKRINNLLQTSAEGAAAACSGGSDGTTCGTSWDGKFDGTYGLGQELSALEIVMANLPSVPIRNVNSTGTSMSGSYNSSTSGTKPSSSPSPVIANGAGALGVSMTSVVGSAILAGILYL